MRMRMRRMSAGPQWLFYKTISRERMTILLHKTVICTIESGRMWGIAGEAYTLLGTVPAVQAKLPQPACMRRPQVCGERAEHQTNLSAASIALSL